MSNDDTFFGSTGFGDRTVMRPRPGGKGHGSGGGPPQQPAPQPQYQPPQQESYGPITHAGLNSLIDAASVLLFTAGQLSGTTSHSDPTGLRNQMNQEIMNFENRARTFGVTPELIFTARYIVCTLLDEVVLSTPWGNRSGWGMQTLLSKFHNETSGGEKFFQILERSLQDPTRNIELLELMYVCMSLGFRGKYRIQDRGRSRLDDIQDQTYHAITSQRGEFERELSPHWQGVSDYRNKLARYVPLWVVFSVACMILFFIWFGFRFNLNSEIEPVTQQLNNIGRNIAPLEQRKPTVRVNAPARVDIARLLAAEIQQKLIYVQDTGDKTTIVIRGDGLFASARTKVAPTRLILLERIAKVLNQVSGQVLVTGHTDSDPITGSLLLRYQSNWDLSQKRAESIVAILAKSMRNPSRLIAEGMADTRPIVANDSAINKSKNRRVEITIFR